MNAIPQLVGRWSLGLCAAALVAMPAFGLRRVANQQIMIGEWGGPMVWNGGGFIDPGDSVNTSLVDGFSVAAGGTDLQDTPAGEAVKFMQARDWLKAIEAIEALDTDDQRLITDPNGILRPLSSLKASLIASLPEEGKKTFRRLNNPAANAKLQTALELEDFVQREQAYQALVNNYALCDAAAQAADTLGDIRFEQGRFDESAALYRFASEHAASKPDDAMLMAKRLLALSRAGLWKQFNDLVEYAMFRHPATNVNLGGTAVPMRSLIQQASAAQHIGGDGTALANTSLPMPTFSGRIFNRELVDDSTRQWLRMSAAQNNVGGVIDNLTAPVVISDGEHLFTLALGSVARLDPETGTDLWREGDTQEHVKSINNRMYQLQQGYHQALVLADDILICVVPDGNYPNRARMIARKADTGELLWTTEKMGGEMRNRGIVGEPIIIDDTIYAVTQKPGEAELRLVGIALHAGTMSRSLVLGSAPNDPNTNAPSELSPRLTMGQGYLFVQTNNGALIAIDPVDFSVAWAFSQKIRGSGMSQRHRWGRHSGGSMMIAKYTGNAITRDGLVIAKDTRSGNVHAFREFDATPAWAAQTDMDATIVHADQRHVYVLGDELVAYDLRTGARAWGTPFAGTHCGEPMFTEDACLIAGSQRFTRVDLATGKLTDYTDDMFQPAELAVIGDKLIHATQTHITAYRLPKPADDQP